MAEKALLITGIQKIGGIGNCIWIKLYEPISLKKGDILYNLRLDEFIVKSVAHPHFDYGIRDVKDEPDQTEFILEVKFPRLTSAKAFERFREGTVVFSGDKVIHMRQDLKMVCGKRLSEYLQ